MPRKNSTPQPLTEEALTNGTAYAIEQAWHLLEDAVLLIQNERHASSVVLAIYCLEQLGRAEIYREKAREAFAGKRILLHSMERELASHVAKLHRAQIPVIATVTFWGDPPASGTNALSDLARRLEETRRILQKSAPSKAERDRLNALHVDRIAAVPGWNRPVESIRKSDADYYVGAANSRYGLLRLEIQRDLTPAGRAIWARIEHLGLPETKWDVWSWRVEEDAAIGELAKDSPNEPTPGSLPPNLERAR